MLWQHCSKVNQTRNVTLAARTFQFSRRSTRTITTARPILQAHAPIQAVSNIEDVSKIQEKAGGPQLRDAVTATVRADATDRTPSQARCAQLLDLNREPSDPEPPDSLINQKLWLSGRIKTIRKQKYGAFAHVTDGSCLQPVQVVLDPELAAPLYNGTSLQVLGTWKESPARGQAHELVAEKVHVSGTTDVEKYPIQKKYHTPDFLRTLPHLRLRTPLNSTLVRFRSFCLSFLSSYASNLDVNGGYFVQVQPPIITSSDCEDGGEVFVVAPNATPPTAPEGGQQDSLIKSASFFRTPKYLSVSSQLHLEAYAAELRNVWALTPIFRAERSDTPRHLAEFYMLEFEMSYTSSLRALTGLIEHLIRSLTAHLISSPPAKELLGANAVSSQQNSELKAEETEKRWNAVVGISDPWKSLSYTYCINHLRKAAEANSDLFERQPELGSSLQLEHERWIVQNLGEDRPVFVTHYPRAIKPFYMAPSILTEDFPQHPQYHRHNHQPSSQPHERFEESETGKDTVACFDLLMPFGLGEIAGGSLREHRLEHLIQNMRDHDMLVPKPDAAAPAKPQNPNTATTTIPNPPPPSTYPHLRPHESLGPLEWYADLRRYGTVPHAGFGIGWDRLIAYLTGVHNLKDVVPFPRSFGKAEC